MELELIAVFFLWLIIGPILYSTFKNLFSTTEEEKEQIKKRKREEKERETRFSKVFIETERKRELKLEKERKKREAEGTFLFDAPSKELEEKFAIRAAYYASKGMDVPYPSKEEIKQMKDEIKAEKKKYE